MAVVISALLISVSNSLNIVWNSSRTNLSLKYKTSSSGWKKGSSGLFTALKYTSNDVNGMSGDFTLAVSFKSFQHNFALLYL